MPLTAKRILVVEDDEGLADLFCELLQQGGARCERAGNAEQCHQWLATHEADLLLVDYSLPDRLAPALIEELRSTGRLRPFIIVTGHGDERVAVEMMKLGARDYLVKDHLVLDRLPAVVKRTLLEIDKERRLADSERALQTSETRLAEALDLAHVAYWEFDVASATYTFNDRFYALYGTTAEREGGYRMPAATYAREFLPPEEAHLIAAEIARALAAPPAQTNWQVDHRIRRRDGALRFIAVHIVVVRDTAGHTVATRGANQDVTERKQAEAALRESEQHYRSLFENMLNGFAYCRMLYDGDRPVDFIYLAVNAAFGALTGLKDVEGRKVSEVIPGIRESDPALFATYGRVARTGRPERLEYHLVAMKMWFALAVYSPRPDHFVAIFDTITERKAAEQRLHEQLSELQRWQALMLDREDRVIGLKREVNDLLQRLAEPVRYPSQVEGGAKTT